MMSAITSRAAPVTFRSSRWLICGTMIADAIPRIITTIRISTRVNARGRCAISGLDVAYTNIVLSRSCYIFGEADLTLVRLLIVARCLNLQLSAFQHAHQAVKL